VPPLEKALSILTNHTPPPAELTAGTREFLSSLSFAERAVLHAHSPGTESLCFIVAVRWRLMAALATRPEGSITPDAAALDQLLAEIDGTLASLSQFSTADDPDLRQACDSARTAIARDVHQLIPTSSGPAAIQGADDVKRLRQALSAAAIFTKNNNQSGGLRIITRGKKGLVLAAVSLACIAGGVFSSMRTLWVEQLTPVPTLPDPPPGTELLGDPQSGTVILRSTDGNPLNGEALEHYRAQAAPKGVTLQRLGPNQALITADATAR
jgi:hypothetical protein